MCKDRTQIYDLEIYEEYIIHTPFPSHIIYSDVQNSIAINKNSNTTN